MFAETIKGMGAWPFSRSNCGSTPARLPARRPSAHPRSAPSPRYMRELPRRTVRPGRSRFGRALPAADRRAARSILLPSRSRCHGTVVVGEPEDDLNGPVPEQKEHDAPSGGPRLKLASFIRAADLRQTLGVRSAKLVENCLWFGSWSGMPNI